MIDANDIAFRGQGHEPVKMFNGDAFTMSPVGHGVGADAQRRPDHTSAAQGLDKGSDCIHTLRLMAICHHVKGDICHAPNMAMSGKDGGMSRTSRPKAQTAAIAGSITATRQVQPQIMVLPVPAPVPPTSPQAIQPP